MSLNKRETFEIYKYIRNKMSEEDMKKIKEKYSDFEEIEEENTKSAIEEAILMLIFKFKVAEEELEEEGTVGEEGTENEIE